MNKTSVKNKIMILKMHLNGQELFKLNSKFKHNNELQMSIS